MTATPVSRQGFGAAALVLPFRWTVELPKGGITLVGAIEETPAVAAAHEILPSELPRPDGTDTAASHILDLILLPARTARALATRLEPMLLHEAVDPNASKLLLLQRVDRGVAWAP